MAVTNFTADQIGDFFFAKLNEAYTNVTNILGCEILVGVNSPNSIGTLALVEGSTSILGTGVNWNLQEGDKFIVGSQAFTVDAITSSEITTVEAATFTATAAKWYEFPDADNHFNYEFRWSQEGLNSDGGQMSELKPLSNPALVALELDPNKPLWIDIKAEVHRLSSLHSLSLLSVTFELETQDGTIQSCPQLCNDCDDPYVAGCTNIVIDCSDPLFDPYNLNRPTAIYKEISELSSRMWGHPVQYFRVEPDKRSKDVVLMEYSLYNVMEQGNLKVMVPDNEMPTREFSYDIFGMGFEDFEIHITQGQMESAFGPGLAPRPRDYMYIPILNRMYEVSSVSHADEFNQTMSYWRVMLRKYEERTSTMVDEGSQIEQQLDELYTGVDEVFGEELQAEYDKTTKPTQYQTVFSEVSDGVRNLIHNNLEILDEQIRNKWTIVSKNHYNLESIKDLGIEALVYNTTAQHKLDDNLAFTVWFRPNFKSPTAEQTLFDGFELGKGFKLTVNQQSIKAYINNNVFEYPFETAPENGNWYGVVYNLNNKYKSTATYVYKLNPAANKLNSLPINDTLIEVMDHKIDIPAKQAWTGNKKWSLMPGDMALTNVRLFVKTIGKDQHHNILNQYVVRDNHLARIIDNAVPSIQLRKYSQNR